MNIKQRKEMNKIGGKVIDGKGAERVAKEISRRIK